jgi:hypothetical protein
MQNAPAGAEAQIVIMVRVYIERRTTASRIRKASADTVVFLI